MQPALLCCSSCLVCAFIKSQTHRPRQAENEIAYVQGRHRRPALRPERARATERGKDAAKGRRRPLIILFCRVEERRVARKPHCRPRRCHIRSWCPCVIKKDHDAGTALINETATRSSVSALRASIGLLSGFGPMRQSPRSRELRLVRQVRPPTVALAQNDRS